MNIKPKSCNCRHCKKQKSRKEKKIVCKKTNKIIRQQNKKVINTDGEYEVDLGKCSFYWA